jgi:replicative DNA helicase
MDEPDYMRDEIPDQEPAETSPYPTDMHDIATEAALLDSCFGGGSTTVMPWVREILTPDDFYSGAHGDLFARALSLTDHGLPALPRLTVAVLRDVMGVDEAKQFIDRLARSATMPASAIRDHARYIRELATRRRAYDVADEFKALVADGHDDPTVLMRALSDVQTALAPEQVEVSNSALMREFLAQDRIPMVRTGVKPLDRMLAASIPESVTVLAGRPGMGKTAVALAVAHELALQDKRVLFFSLEMSKLQCLTRVASRACGVPYQDITRLDLNLETKIRVQDAIDDLPDALQVIELKTAPTIHAIQSMVQREQARSGHVELVILDYLGLIRPDNMRQSRYEQITQISVDCKGMAKVTGVPLLLCAQLSRAVEQRDDKRPRESDLRDSGNIEQDADGIALLYRGSKYNRFDGDYGSMEHVDWVAENPRSDPNDLDILLVKNRHGATDEQIPAWVDMATGRLSEPE